MRRQKNKFFTIVVGLIILFGSQFNTHAQTCSCAAAPLFDPIEYSTLKDRKWRFELSFKYHALNDLVEGTEKVVDDTDRTRTSQFLMLDVRYSLSRNVTLRAVFSFARQYRDVGISSAAPVSTNGLGDSMLSIQYSPIHYSPKNLTEVALGGGIKFPVGHNDARIIGIASEDMQPGSGSWDTLIWGYASHLLLPGNGFEVFGGVSARFNGTNSRDYRFGNEVIASLGSRLLTKNNLGIALYGRYRWADYDKRFNGNVPNTGGQWIYIVPSITINIQRDWGIKAEVELPVYRKLNGFRQFTTTYLASVSVFYLI
ncbi:MAG: transporter [Candidatus Aminicenantes bacterium]|nr:MAG: transporter [Candidatus Aminicenantes bacterium]